jgi:hypothetical protein
VHIALLHLLTVSQVGGYVPNFFDPSLDLVYLRCGQKEEGTVNSCIRQAS